MTFYPDIKEGLSPSAIAQWFNSRSSFVKSYFQGERGPETSAMKSGTMIHALIEAGIIKAKHVYDGNEREIHMDLGNKKAFRGRPDSHQTKQEKDVVEFVDYKSGKANAWADKLPTDIKMRATAWLVWKQAGCPKTVKGFVEFIQTTWDPEAKKIVPIEGKETEVVAITYDTEELQEFTKVIENTMDEINLFYEKWLKSTGGFVNRDDIARYVELKSQILHRETEMDEIGERILSQMEFGGEENHKTGFGTFYVKETSKYEYPGTLKIYYLDYGLVLEDAQAIDAAAKGAKKNFELANEPKETKRSITFRPAKEK